MRTVAKVTVDFRTALAKQLGESFTTEVAAAFGEDVKRRAKENVAPGVGPSQHPHPPPPAWQHRDTGQLMDSIQADITKSANKVTVNIFTDETAPYSVFLEAGWHGPSGKFYRYPWLAPALIAAQREFMNLVRSRSAIAFTGGPRGGLIGIKRGANVWQTPGWKKP